jgi:ubiquinone/menaquinone biosynthesis C-methylase UbiE
MARDLTARYEAAASGWGRRMAWLGFPQAYRAALGQVLPGLPQGPISALDIGAGDGAFAAALADGIGAELKLALLDRSPAMLRAAEARLGPGRARLITGDLMQAGLAGETFDLVTSAHVIEHLPDPAAALLQMARLTRPGGRLVLVVSQPHWCSHLVWLAWRHRRFRAAEVLGLLQRAGWEDPQCWQFPPGPPRRLSLVYSARRPR